MKNNNYDFEQARRRGKSKEILRSLYSLRMTGGKGVNVFSLSKGEGQGEGLITNLRKELINLYTYPLINFQKAFTLAEVLITLGIIGVVAAITIPNLVTKIQDIQFKTAAKKAYAVTGQAFKSMQEDGKILEDYVLNPQTFKNEFMTYFKVIEDCGFNRCVPTSYHSDIYKTLNGEKADAALLDEGQFTTLDGQFFMIQNSQYFNWLFISVDVNGYKSKPNIWGRDVFTFWIDESGNLNPMGSPNSQWPAKISCNRKKALISGAGSIQGIGCMYNVINNIDY